MSLRDGLQRWLDARARWGEGLRVTSVTAATTGHSNDTFIADLDGDDGHRRIVLRRPAASPTHLDAPLARQVAVHQALARAGVAVPWPAHHEPDESWLGAEFLTMAFVEGHVVGEVPAADPWVVGATAAHRRAVHDAFGDALASVHMAGAAQAALSDTVPGAGAGLDDDLERWRELLTWAARGRPPAPVREALAWCAAHRPGPEPPRTLTWGDARLGNAVFAEDGTVRGLLDWETARIGPPEFDVGWWVGLESVTAGLLGAIDGFRHREEVWARWEAAVGRTAVSPEWFEVLAVTAAACFTVRLDTLARDAPPADDEVAAHPLLVWLADRTG